VIKAVGKIKSNASGIDEIPLIFLKKLLPVIFPYLLHIYNHCITTSKIPSAWKSGIVLPIAKKAKVEALKDIRKIAILIL
jgi:hypothetical protein